MENLLQSPATRGKKSLLRSSSSGIFGTAPKVLKAREVRDPSAAPVACSLNPAQQQPQTATQAPSNAAIVETVVASPDKGTPSRKRNIEASKVDSTRAVLSSAADQPADVKKLTAEVVEQKRIIAELTAQKETLEHVRAIRPLAL